LLLGVRYDQLEYDFPYIVMLCCSVGLAHLSLGNVFDAESYLQLSARWAQTPLEQLVALTNLGMQSP
jgi:hypothetical protein